MKCVVALQIYTRKVAGQLLIIGEDHAYYLRAPLLGRILVRCLRTARLENVPARSKDKPQNVDERLKVGGHSYRQRGSLKKRPEALGVGRDENNKYLAQHAVDDFGFDNNWDEDPRWRAKWG